MTAGRQLFAALAALALWACRPEVIDPMKRQRRFNSYQPSPVFDDRRELRPPIPGTVPRERPIQLAPEATGRMADGTLAPTIPVRLDRAALLKGRQSFERICGTCHGDLADGNSVPATKMSLRGAPSLFLFRDRPPGFFYEVMTRGWGFMPSYAGMLEPEERWQIVGYLQALFLSQTAGLDQAPADVQAKLQQEAKP
jgi:mono/diheme cytochrome c family protein